MQLWSSLQNMLLCTSTRYITSTQCLHVSTSLWLCILLFLIPYFLTESGWRFSFESSAPLWWPCYSMYVCHCIHVVICSRGFSPQSACSSTGTCTLQDWVLPSLWLHHCLLQNGRSGNFHLGAGNWGNIPDQGISTHPENRMRLIHKVRWVDTFLILPHQCSFYLLNSCNTES